MKISRRDVVAGLLSVGPAGAASGQTPAGPGAAGPTFGPPQAFSWSALQARARALARQAYRARPNPLANQLGALDFDAIGQVRYRPDAALWPADDRIGAVEFFHLGKYAQTPVTIHVLDAGVAREVLYAPALFAIPPGNPAGALPPDLGFAGFRVLEPGARTDWIAYQGGSYFRAADPFNQYGLSARGLAIDTAAAGPEEFPAFTRFWLERGADGLVVYALLEGPSVTGAYRLLHRRGPAGLVQEIEASLAFRAGVRQLGIAPLTSMFWYGAEGRGAAGDWRPQIHDSDGLSLWTGQGERLWRPLANPPRVATHAFMDADPKGFGLMQRDRTFDDYQDDGAFYDRRPSAWVEPAGAWGAGSVRLVEIPTRSETEDNIVAFWTPAKPVSAGDEMDVRYRLRWTAREPEPPGVAQAVATWKGAGGRPGLPPSPGVRKVVVDFEGGRLAGLTRQSGVVPVVSAGQGQPMDAVAYAVVGTRRWRLMFDIASPKGKELDLRAFLRLGDDALTETWIDTEYG
ncbi:MAG TPA: glucan biosynthesis protein [Caulobacteraceae bacterium]|nr:glucan biosynthesis protein [Caulobacteraceae bacterium]